jgi:excinuclease UvrABC ATPase subunit
LDFALESVHCIFKRHLRIHEFAAGAVGLAQGVEVAGLVGVVYVLDEPSIGLHQRGNDRLLGTLKGLRNLGNTVIAVEHDEQTIRTAAFVVDMGPGQVP